MPYAYLPLAAGRDPPFGWGHTATAAGFLTHLLRREYGTFQLGAGGLAHDWAQFPARLAFYLTGTLTDLAYVGLPLAALGVAATLRSASKGASPRRLHALTAGRHRAGERHAVLVLVAAWVVFSAVFVLLANLPVTVPLQLGVQARPRS
jgi:hypothetical protein